MVAADIKKAAEMQKQNTRNCPNCEVPILKLDAICGQMWCLHCHTVVDWNTLTIVDIRHHRHHYNYNASSIEAAELPPLDDKMPADKDFSDIHHAVKRIQEVDLPKLELLSEYNEQSHEWMRFEYLTEDAFDLKALSNEIYLEERCRARARHLLAILQMYTTVGIEILHKARAANAKASAFVLQLQDLRYYVNDRLYRLRKVLSMGMGRIQDNYRFSLYSVYY